MVTFEYAKETDSGTWNIIATRCSRGRGRNHDKAIVLVDKAINSASDNNGNCADIA